MSRYSATIRHHSISRARVVDAGDTLAAAKRAASREFGAEQLDYEIVIMDASAAPMCGYIVASRKVGDTRWAVTE